MFELKGLPSLRQPDGTLFQVTTFGLVEAEKGPKEPVSPESPLSPDAQKVPNAH